MSGLSGAAPNRRVLVADDDDAVRRLVVTLLKREGFVVDSARNGAEAKQKIAACSYDAIVLDLMMPVADGFDVIEQMEVSAPGTARDRVIVLTAAANRDLASLDSSSVFCLLRKPFDMNELTDVVRRCACKKG